MSDDEDLVQLIGVQDGDTAIQDDIVPDDERLSQSIVPVDGPLLSRKLSILTEAQLEQKFIDYGPRNWDQACQAAVRLACQWTGGAPTPNYLTANEAYRASKIVSKDAKAAPIGAVHYWAIGSYGHVAGGLGGERVFMASKNIDTFWGPKSRNIGVTTVSRYSAKTGARYLGWARSNGHNVLRLRKATTPAPSPSKGRKYAVVKANEGGIAVAARVKIPYATLQKLNPGVDMSHLRVGQHLWIS